MSRHNISSRRSDVGRQVMPSSAAKGEKWSYSMEAVVLLWAGSASSPRFQHVDGGGDSGRGGGVAGVAVREGRVLHPWGDRGGQLVRYGLIVPGGILESK